MAFPVQGGDRLPVRVLRAIWRGMMALDDHWIGDVIGVIGLIVILYLSCVAVLVFGVQ